MYRRSGVNNSHVHTHSTVSLHVSLRSSLTHTQTARHGRISRDVTPIRHTSESIIESMSYRSSTVSSISLSGSASGLAAHARR